MKMHFITLRVSMFFCLLGMSSVLFAQDALQQATDYLQSNAEKFDLTDDVQWRVLDNFTDKDGVSHVRLLQTYQEIDLETQMVAVHIKDNEVFHVTGAFIGEIATLASTEESLAATTALQTSLQNRSLNTTFDLSPISISSQANKKTLYNLDDIALQNIEVQLLYTVLSDTDVRLVWDVDIYEKSANNWWSIKVDANTGAIVDVKDQVLHCDFGAPDPHEHIRRLNELEEMPCEEATALVEQGYITYSAYGSSIIVDEKHKHQHIEATNILANTYRALPLTIESPNHGNFELLANPAASNTTASPNGWHDDDTNSYTITRGNNVWAQEDQNGNNGTGFSPDGGAGLNFDWTFDPNSSPTTGDNLNAAITNLFVWNNFMHDIFYNYGFTEVNSNFQESNFGRGGSGGDFVFADAQDGSGSNNANFGTPSDGGNPRMQMFLWDASATTAFSVNSPMNIAGDYNAVVAAFGDQDFSVSGDLVLVEDGSGNNESCNSITNSAAINGNIAVIDRGNCQFGVKVLAAENAGAIAVVICNNTAGSIISMGAGTDGGSVTIPSVMISQSDCATIRTEIPTVNVSMSSTPGGFQINGDFDNGIIAHEYGHGISNRMTSSSANCLGNAEQMGEGWSDWWGMVLTVKPSQNADTPRGIGTYASGEPTTGGGIRPFPYSRDMGVNPVTYADVANTASFSQPHGIGSIWCSMIWDLYWDLVDVYGYDTDLYNGTGGNNIAMNLVTQGCTYQGCSPGFVDGRDGILAADQALYGGANECIIWEAFARRGLGFSASQGSSSSRTDGTEAFDLPPTDFDITATNSPISVCQPLDAVFDFDIAFLGGFSDTVSLSATGLPTGLSASFSANPAPSDGTYTMTISGTANVAAGTYNFSINGINGCLNRSAAVVLNVDEALSSAPSLTSPLDGATTISLAPVFTWESLSGASSYNLEVATDIGFSNIVISELEINDTAYSASDLSTSTTYYWRVTGVNNCGVGTWSNTFSFTTILACIEDLMMDDNPILADTYSVADSINSAGTIQSPDTVIFQAGTLIRLSPGFIVENGATFTAQIQDCTPSAQEAAVEQRSEKIVKENEIKVFPNPFSDLTTIELQLVEQSDLVIELYTLTGQKVKTIVQTNNMLAGVHQFSIDATNLKSGMYLLMLNVEDKIQIKKLSLIK